MARKKKSKTKYVVLTVIAVIAVAAVSLFAAAPRKTNYTTVKATKGDLTTYYSFSGSVDAKNRQKVYADQSMQINEINVSAGQAVKKDDVLMKTTSGEEIKAPIDGDVSEIDVDKDAMAMPGAKLCEVVDYNDLQLVVQVDEYDLSAVSVGKKAAVTIHALNKDISGTITDVAKEGVYTDGITYFNTTISLTSESDLRVGMSAEAKVLNQSAKNVVILPMSAIQFDDNDKPYVQTLDSNKKPQNISVTLGINDGTNVEVKSGVTEGTEVVKPAVQSATTAGFGGMRNGGAGTAANSTNSNFSTNNTASATAGGAD